MSSEAEQRAGATGSPTAPQPGVSESSPKRPSGNLSLGPLAIRVEDLSKNFKIGDAELYGTLRDTLSRAFTAPWRRWANRRRAKEISSETERSFWALRDVSFEVRQGDVVGLIGRNGAGKSTLLRILSRITEPTHGQAEIRGRVGSLLEVGSGFHGELTGRENIFLNGAILGMPRAQIRARFDEIVAFAEVSKFIDTPVKHYSSGMFMRLAFAVAAHLEPDILLVDEVLAVGDVQFQKKCLGKMEDVARSGRTVLFVSHNMGAVRSLCNTGVVLNEGRVIQIGDISECMETYFRLVGAFQPAEGKTEGDYSGFGSVRINGKRTNSVSQSQAFEAETTLRMNGDFAGFELVCTLEDMQGRKVFQVRKPSSSFDIRQDGPGEYAIRIAIPPLWLNTGLYSLFFRAICRGDYRNSASHVSDKVPLDVTGNHSPADGMLHPDASWTVVPGTSR
jgi:homopolymeric O-antigen transport system ATP-binding protein